MRVVGVFFAPFFATTLASACGSEPCHEPPGGAWSDQLSTTDTHYRAVTSLPDRPTAADCAKQLGCEHCGFARFPSPTPIGSDAGPRPECPTTQPKDGDPCPSLTKCTYERGTEWCTSMCSDTSGKQSWSSQCQTITPSTPCPADLPVEGTPCVGSSYCVWPSSGRCTFVSGRCDGSTWTFDSCFPSATEVLAVGCYQGMITCPFEE